MDADGREQLKRAFNELRERVPNPPSNKTLAVRATRQLQGKGAISFQAIGSWRRDGAPARDLNHLLVVVKVLTDMAGPHAVQFRRDEWSDLHARARDVPSRRGSRSSDPASVESNSDDADEPAVEFAPTNPKEVSPGDARSAHSVFADADKPWLNDDTTRVLRAAVRGSQLSPASLAVFVRWWQFERWIRELVYVESRARFGIEWTSVAPSVDASDPDPFAELSFGELAEAVNANWELFEYALPGRALWDGMRTELEGIWRRISRLRHPLDADLDRLEQLLRDIEPGCFAALSAYNDMLEFPWRKMDPGMPVGPAEVADPQDRWPEDPVTRGWGRREHEVADRLIAHADRRYGVAFEFGVTRRPWVSAGASLGGPGWLWRVQFVSSQRPFDIESIWSDIDREDVLPLVIHLTANSPFDLGFTFAAVDDGARVADAIGIVFDAVILAGGPKAWDPDRLFVDFSDRAGHLWASDHRMQMGTRWSIVDPTTAPVSIFGAGAQVSVGAAKRMSATIRRAWPR